MSIFYSFCRVFSAFFVKNMYSMHHQIINKKIVMQSAILLCCFLFPFFINAQVFERIENNARFPQLLNNTGIAVADYDNDHDLDIFLVAKNDFASIQPNTQSRLLQNNNDGTFSDVTDAAGFSGIYNYDEADPGWEYGVKMGVSWGDYDKDGFADLLLTNYRHLQLFRNQGDGSFAEVTTTAGLPMADSCYYTSALWWDLDKDGDLDAYVTKWGGCSQNRYFKNEGNGTFVEKTEILNLGGTKDKTWMATPMDANQDGRWDIYLANDFAKNELLIQNADGTFTEQAAAFQLDLNGNDMGITTGDYNNDGQFDLFITNIDNNRLLSPTPNSTYENVAESKNVAHTYWAWGCQFADMDLDGDEDLFVANGYQNDQFYFPVLKNNFLFKNLHLEGQDTFQNISAATGVDEFSNSMCLNVFDYDVDGDLDVFVSNMDDTPFFYENKVTNEGENEPNWTNIELKGTISNQNGLGSKITIWADGKAQYRLKTGANLLSQSLTAVHFGLGNATIIDSLKIEWDLGLIEKFYNLPVNEYLEIQENAGLTVLNLQNDKIFGCTDPNSCTYNPAATVENGSCSYRPPVEIMGKTNSGYLKTEIYTCNQNPNSTYHWSVENGDILAGQGTPTVTIQWHLAKEGQLILKEINECESEESELIVALSLANMDEKHSIARLWNEALLLAIRRDFARPTVHARNLFHTSVAMYDAWAIYDDEARTYLLGKTVGDFTSEMPDGETPIYNSVENRRETLSFAMYRLLHHRFLQSPGYPVVRHVFDDLMEELGYDASQNSTDYSDGNPAALGNFIAQTVIDFGKQDGATELQGYANAYYETSNPPLITNQAGVSDTINPNRWQPLSFETFIDQSGNLIEGTTPDFLSPEWGNVTPFSLSESTKKTYQRNGDTYHVFHDPDRPPYLDTLQNTAESEQYKWGFSLVSIWGSQLSPDDGALWDISPAGIGNVGLEELPTDFADFPDFYQLLEGGDIGKGRSRNPITQQPYPEQLVPRGDYARVLAEFWADGPDSETPPGHWFVLLNKVNDHPELTKKLGGKGQPLTDLEWDVKSYFILGGTMHDAAIAAWSVKGWYDYIRPISAIRYLAERGQSSDPTLPNYDVAGIPLVEGWVEMVKAGDPLAGVNEQHLGKIKLYTWRGHRYINDPETDAAGVDWILAEDWMPYQRISFVTPPFAGYVSGHSTYSRAAAEAMTLLTGDEYFPGGVGEFVAYQNEFLVFEEGPSQDVILQWATYQDASDQCSLSRIWGGIHPPADDIPGRLMGEKIGQAAFRFAVPYFSSEVATTEELPLILYPNPVAKSGVLTLTNTTAEMDFKMANSLGKLVAMESVVFDAVFGCTEIRIGDLAAGVYFIYGEDRVWEVVVF